MNKLKHLGLLTSVGALFVQGLDAQCSGGRRSSNPAAPGQAAAPSPSAPSTPAPSTPSTPAPSTPSTPAPTTPNTPRINQPGPRTGGPGARGPRTPGGVVIPMTRKATAKGLLKLDWDYPVAKTFEKEDTGKGTRAASIKKALPRIEAFKQIAGDDPRPLLVMRECSHCVGTDKALLNRSMDSEKTQLLARWFHCVKLPPEVLRLDHPFANLFQGDTPPHLFFCSPDGSNLVTFLGDQKQTDLWKGMEKVIDVSYKKSPKTAVRAMMRMLSEFDKFDGLEKTYQENIRRRILKDGPDAPQLKKMEKKLARVQARKKKAMERAKAVCDLKLIVAKN